MCNDCKQRRSVRRYLTTIGMVVLCFVCSLKYRAIVAIDDWTGPWTGYTNTIEQNVAQVSGTSTMPAMPNYPWPDYPWRF